MSNIFNINAITLLDLDADQTLENLKGKLDGFVLCGYGIDGEMFFSSTYGDIKESLYLLEHCKKALLAYEQN